MPQGTQRKGNNKDKLHTEVEKSNCIVAVDLGSGYVTVAAASKDADGRLNIIDVARKPVEGMSCGEIINIEQVTKATREAVRQIEESLGIEVREVYAGISGQDIKCADSSYYVYVNGEDHEIREDDLMRLHESMNNLQAPEGICILDRTPQKYVIDSTEETMQPIGRFGQQLDTTFNFTLGSRSSVDRIQKAFSRLGITVRKFFTDAQASAAAILTEDDKELGAAAINIGAGCTDICIWQDSIMRYVAVLPIGSAAINSDIRATAIPERHIEKLKINYGYASPVHIPDDLKSKTVTIKGRTAREDKVISLYNLAQIIEARMLDIVENVMEEIKDSGYADKLGAGLVLTGGGALLQEADTLFRERTKFDVRLAGPEASLLNDDSKKAAEDICLSTVVGLLLLGMEDAGIAGGEPHPQKTVHAEQQPTAKPLPRKETTVNKPSPAPRPEPVPEPDAPSDTDIDTDLDETPEQPPIRKGRKPKKDKEGKEPWWKRIFTDLYTVDTDDTI